MRDWKEELANVQTNEDMYKVALLANQELCRPAWDWQHSPENDSFLHNDLEHACEAAALVGAKAHTQANPMLAMLGIELVSIVKSAAIMGYALAKTGILEQPNIPQPFIEGME